MKPFFMMLLAVGIIVGADRMIERGYIYCGTVSCTMLYPWEGSTMYSYPSYPVPYTQQFPAEPPPPLYDEEMQVPQKCSQHLDQHDAYDWEYLNKQRYCI